MENKEVWKDIPGHNGRYQASTLGRIRSFWCKPGIPRKTPKILRPYLHENGSLCLVLRVNQKPVTCIAHRLIAKTFLDNPDNLPEVNHLNFIRHDNRIENLEWVTGKENVQHAVRNNRILYQVGEKSHKSKLTDKQRSEIVKLREEGMSLYKIAKLYSVDHSTLGKWLKRRLQVAERDMQRRMVKEFGHERMQFEV